MSAGSGQRAVRSTGRSPGQRAGITEHDIIDAALAILDDDPEALSLTEVARRLGVQAPSLYSHVSGLAALKRMVRIRVSHDLGRDLHLAALGPTDPAEALAAVLGACRAHARRFPSRWLVATSTTIGATDPAFAQSIAHNRSVLTPVLQAFGIPTADLVHWETYVWAWTYGYLGFELAHRDPGFTPARFRRQVSDIADQLTRAGAG